MPTPKKTPRPEAAASELPGTSYLVGLCPVLHDGRLYGVGFEIVLTDEQAQRLGAKVTPLAHPATSFLE